MPCARWNGRQPRDRERVERLDRARAYAPQCWSAYRPLHEPGERHLAERGLGALIGRSELVRFSTRGDVCVQLHALNDGATINVVRRRLPPIAEGEPRVKGLTGATLIPSRRVRRLRQPQPRQVSARVDTWDPGVLLRGRQGAYFGRNRWRRSSRREAIRAKSANSAVW